ncbi:MAG: porphobilinogen synthase [Euryarchaeota archaeon]|nr:porphobilinogen synthase [Euryarchaeota archaeon]
MRTETHLAELAPRDRSVARPRRLRAHGAIRDAIADASVDPARLALPVFALDGDGREEPIASLPGHARLGPDRLVERLAPLVDAGLRSVMVFGVPDDKHDDARTLTAEDGPAQKALHALREAFGDRLLLMADVCLCPHTTHGHCGVPVTDASTGRVRIDGDAALPLLSAGAVSLARAGADWVAPSDMMDGRVAAVRTALDDAGHRDTAILSYTAKFASAHYGPFREAAGSAPAFGDRRTYQMDPRGVRDALRSARLDETAGADMLLVKPGLPYLDVLSALHDRTDLPLAAYHVSGEYAMVHAAAERGWVDARAVYEEQLVALRRAGADLVLTYAALDILSEDI